MTFEDFKHYDNVQLNNILKNGEAPERVYAAWTLAIRNTSFKQIEYQLINAPDPGTRCHLIILIAGQKRIDLLLVLVKHDPNELVRATALKYLNQIQYNDIISLTLNLYKNEKSKTIHKTIFNILQQHDVKLKKTNLLHEIEKLDFYENSNFLEYMLSVYDADKLSDKLLLRLLETKYISNYKLKTINWIKSHRGDENLILLLSKLEKSYISYLEYLINNNFSLSLSYKFLNDLPLIAEADKLIHFNLLNKYNNNAFANFYLSRLKIYYFNNSFNVMEYNDDYLYEILENFDKYNLCNNDLKIILEILTIEDESLSSDSIYDIKEYEWEKEYYQECIKKVQAKISHNKYEAEH